LSVSSKAGSGTRVTMTFPSQANATTPLVADQRKYG